MIRVWSVTLGALFGVVLAWSAHVWPWIPPPKNRRAADEGRRLVYCYAKSLSAASRAIELFLNSTFVSQQELKSAAQPLADATELMNQAYTSLALASPHLMLSLQQLGETKLACKLQAVDRFQWNTMRPIMNGLSVDFVNVWQGPVSADVLESVRFEQHRGWLEVRERLLFGVRQFTEPTTPREHNCDTARSEKAQGNGR